MNISKPYEKFPIYLIKNFEEIEDSLKVALMAVVLENKFRNHEGNGGSFLIDEDYRNFFKNLYIKFFDVSKNIFGDFTLSSNNSISCWSYTSNKFHHGPGILHNHLSTSTINSVYYLNVPKTVSITHGSISFLLNGEEFAYKPENGDLLIFPNYLNHKINFLDDEEYRISINMEITTEETVSELFEFKKLWQNK